MEGPDPTLGDVLKAEADRYEPDHERIMRRIRNPQAGDLRVESRRAQLHGTDRHRRPGLLVPAVAASLVALIAGAIAAIDPLDTTDGQPVQVAADQTPSDISATGATTSSSTTGASPTPSQAVGTPVSSATTPSRPSPSATSSTVPPAVPAAGVQLGVVDAGAGQSVVLPGSAVDWLIAGNRADGTVVRRQNGAQLISGPHATGNPRVASADGPFSLSWSGGMPERTGSSAGDWYTVSRPDGSPKTGLEVRAPAGGKAGKLVLYVGAREVDGRIEARLGKDKVSHKLRASSTGYVVTVTFRTGGSAGEVSVDVLSGAGGSVALAAVALS